MTRTWRSRRLASLLPLGAAKTACSARAPFTFCRAIASTCASRGKNTDWVRGKLWKGEAPGPEDPYTQRADTETPSHLPEEALDLPRADKTPAAVLNSRLAVPPRRSEAATEKEVAASDSTYAPASEAAGLEEVGTLSSWWAQEGHWGQESQFRGFGNPIRVVDRHVVEVCLRQAVVEVLALQETGALSEWSTKKWRKISRRELDPVFEAKIDVQQDGRATLVGNAAAITQSLGLEGDEAETAGDDYVLSPGEAHEMVKLWDATWKGLVLDDQLKFALRKRLYQLTGNLIPDARLGAAVSVKHLLTLASKQPKPKKLAEILEQRSDIVQLANVKVHSRKIGPVEKETTLGRWKVIEEELTKRGLPVTGTAGLSRNKERDWISGKI